MLKPFLTGLLIGCVSVLLLMQYHLLRTNDGLIIVARMHQPPLLSAYADIRHWSPQTWERYPEVSTALVKSGRGDLIVNGALENLAPKSSSRTDSRNTSIPQNTRRAINALVPVQLTDGITPADELPEPAAPAPPRHSQRSNSRFPASSPAAANASTRMRPLEMIDPSVVKSPEFDRPIPFRRDFVETGRSGDAPVAIDHNGSEPGEKSDWMSSFLKSLIPGTEAKRTNSPQYQAGLNLDAAAHPQGTFRNSSPAGQFPPPSRPLPPDPRQTIKAF